MEFEETSQILEHLPAMTRLQLCLKFLASGAPFDTISDLFRVTVPAVFEIVHEVYQKIWEVIGAKFVVLPKTSKEWLKISSDFEARWDYPYCLGAINGKHINLKAP